MLKTSYYKLLTKVYNANVFPVKNPNDILIVDLDLSLIQLLVVVNNSNIVKANLKTNWDFVMKDDTQKPLLCLDLSIWFKNL